MVAGEDGWSIEEPNYEGIRVRCDDPSEHGWFLLRLSLHDPLKPLNVESDVKGGAKAIASRLRQLLEAFEFLDTSSLP
jgi:phosphomannomutase